MTCSRSSMPCQQSSAAGFFALEIRQACPYQLLDEDLGKRRMRGEMEASPGPSVTLQRFGVRGEERIGQGVDAAVCLPACEPHHRATTDLERRHPVADRLDRTGKQLPELEPQALQGLALIRRQPGEVVVDHPSAEDAVLDVGRERRLHDAEVLETEGLVETLEQSLAATQHDGGDGDEQLVDLATAERLADDICAAHQRHVLVPGGVSGSCDRLVEAVHEGEPGTRGSVFAPVRHDEEW